MDQISKLYQIHKSSYGFSNNVLFGSAIFKTPFACRASHINSCKKKVIIIVTKSLLYILFVPKDSNKLDTLIDSIK